MEALQKVEALTPAVVESLVLNADLSKLSPAQKVEYVRYRCSALGLDPAAKPFELLTLNGKQVLYATAACTQQLCESRKLSVTLVGHEMVGEVIVVTARVSDKDRATENVGAVAVATLKGDALANALMKARTKAIRRTVLAHCGLGMLDETETETIPGARVEPLEPIRPAVVEHVESMSGSTPVPPETQVEAPKAVDPVQSAPGDYVLNWGLCKGKSLAQCDPNKLTQQVEWAEKKGIKADDVALINSFLDSLAERAMEQSKATVNTMFPPEEDNQ